MPIDTDSITTDSISIYTYPLKKLFLRVFLLLIFIYLMIDLVAGITGLLSDSYYHLLFSPLLFFEKFNLFLTPGQVMDDFPTLSGILMGFVILALFICMLLGSKLLDILALLIPPPKKKEPTRVILSKSGVKIYYTNRKEGKIDTMTGNKDFFGLFIKIESRDYRLRLYIVKDPLLQMSTKYPGEEEEYQYYKFFHKDLLQVELGKMFISGKDRQRALGFLQVYLRKNHYDMFIDEEIEICRLKKNC
ncbi:hypothetical protein DSAG12_02673 [Promethearchaeum syntrophicum]|uniref:Uncharacterized protein n=1 Tax=Promethearchaeum syntrophicum TaxID=2594042 RepID=A0A5B9DDK7_9ARCH|nr:hypothetical protein [Candidatus Prometheoarchaeum syntrophicum]QEE16843.1 hypothetical protein DSAG12_02673 [Candidatus Prometheoarchaeum syntrophicum]